MSTVSSPPAPPAPVDLLVDWELAARTAALITRAGPSLPASEAADAVQELRAGARAAVPHVARVSGLNCPPGPDALVVDRASWARVNTTALRTLLAPVVSEVFERRGRMPSASLSAVGSRVSGAEVGSLLGFLSSRVLGQYDIFSDRAGGFSEQPGAFADPAAGLSEGSAEGGPGQLLLVAPNVVQIERELDVDRADFRFWVCLHEETHRAQFGANPWLAPHLFAEVRALVGGLMIEPAQLAERLIAAARGLPDAVRGATSASGSGLPLMDAIQTPEGRERLGRLTAAMSLLEGHADVMMDAVGPEVVPSVALIRERFSQRRAGRGALDQLVRKALGLDAKMRQYAEGARFVRRVIDAVGVDGLNAVWTGPEQLPLPAEIADPVAWVRRVHG